MICMNFRMVLYCAVRRRLMTLWISRTVAGPVDHSTVRISSSASVGLGGSAAIYEDFTSKGFVCQEGGSKRGMRNRFLWSRLGLASGQERDDAGCSGIGRATLCDFTGVSTAEW